MRAVSRFCWICSWRRSRGIFLVGIINDLWIILRGDFVLDTNGNAIDAEFVRAELPSGDRPKSSLAGIQGGLFESWFKIKPQG